MTKTKRNQEIAVASLIARAKNPNFQLLGGWIEGNCIDIVTQALVATKGHKSSTAYMYATKLIRSMIEEKKIIVYRDNYGCRGLGLIQKYMFLNQQKTTPATCASSCAIPKTKKKLAQADFRSPFYFFDNWTHAK